MRTVLVLAKNYKEFKHGVQEVIRRNGSPYVDVVFELSNSKAKIEHSTYFFISSPERMRGFHGVDVEFWGDWMANRTFEEIDEIKMLTSIARNP